MVFSQALPPTEIAGFEDGKGQWFRYELFDPCPKLFRELVHTPIKTGIVIMAPDLFPDPAPLWWSALEGRKACFSSLTYGGRRSRDV